MSKSIEFLQKWYKSQCDGVWEKKYGITIETVDNPGWWIEIDLENTEHVNKKFEKQKQDLGDNDWFFCFVRDQKIQGSSSPQYLGFILSQFCNWVDNSYEEESDQLIGYLQGWYQSYCNGDWEHNKNILIESKEGMGWSVFINLEETNLEGEIFDDVKIERAEGDWVHCAVEENAFRAKCGLCNLVEVLKIFREWAENGPDKT
jgi:hypothetical protein